MTEVAVALITIMAATPNIVITRTRVVATAVTLAAVVGETWDLMSNIALAKDRDRVKDRIG